MWLIKTIFVMFDGRSHNESIGLCMKTDWVQVDYTIEITNSFDIWLMKTFVTFDGRNNKNQKITYWPMYKNELGLSQQYN